MKTLKIPLIETQVNDAAQISALMDENGVKWQAVDNNNWPEAYPYTPRAEFRIAHCGDAFLVNYRADEETIKAAYANDNGQVWTDSCMEFFLSPKPEDGIYYNLECNCIGTVLLGARGGNVEKAHAPAEVMDGILRWSSLGRETFAETKADSAWEVALKVPFSAYWHHKEMGKTMRANFYKCGDDLAKPHFLSWNKIDWEKPNFHLPQFFGEIELGQD